ncbi:MAG: Ig-like domain-containing protein [Solirubrobacterales bacterium]
MGRRIFDRAVHVRRRRFRAVLLAAGLASLLLAPSALAANAQITGGPGVTSPGLTNDNMPTFDFTSDNVLDTYECQVDSTDETGFVGCQPQYEIPEVLDGDHIFYVRAIDPIAGTDPEPAEQGFTVDTMAPDTTIDSGPSGPTNNNDPEFTINTEDGARIECRLDGPGAATGSFAPCASLNSYTNLADGAYTLQAQAIDAASNTDPTPASRNFAVDTMPPSLSIDSGPVGTTADDTPIFTFTAENGSTVRCRVDSAPFAPCSGNGSHTPTPLGDGAHSFQVQATDDAGNVSTRTRDFTVDTTLPPDTTAPDTTIGKGPKAKIKTKKKQVLVKVTFRSEPGSAFECRVDKGKFKRCGSPFRAKVKSRGGKGRKHTISVRAIDPSGNVGEPAKVGFRVVRSPRLRAPVARQTIKKALQRHGFARRVVRALRVDCKRRGRTAFACKLTARFPGYKLRGSGKVQLRKGISYRLRVRAQGIRFVLTDENEARG